MGLLSVQPPTVPVIKMVIDLLDRDGSLVGEAVGTLLRLVAVARGEVRGRPYAGEGILDVERRLPTWSIPEGTSALTLKARYAVEEFAPQVVGRLQRLAETETYPRLLPLVLSAFGAKDEAFEAAVRRTAASAGLGRYVGVVPDGISVEIPPAWDRPDALVEWGMLNPFGPTRSHLLIVPIDETTSSVVFAMHNPSAHECLIVAQVPTASPHALSNVLIEVAEHFQFGEVVLLGNLPHWVAFRPDLPVLDMFQRMHAGAWLRGRGGEILEGEIEQLRRLRADPAAELDRQVAEAAPSVQKALSGDVNGALDDVARYGRPSAIGWSKEDYTRWLVEASDPRHVAALVSHFLPCWQTGERTAAGDISWIKFPSETPTLRDDES
jgi:hypothetical protein